MGIRSSVKNICGLLWLGEKVGIRREILTLFSMYVCEILFTYNVKVERNLKIDGTKKILY